MNKFDQGDAGIGTVMVTVVTERWMASDKFPPLVGFGRKLFPGKNKPRIWPAGGLAKLSDDFARCPDDNRLHVARS